MPRSSRQVWIPAPVESRLHEVQAARSRLTLVQAAVAALLVLLLAMCSAMLVDWTVTLFDSTLRVGLTLTSVIAAAVTLLAVVFVGRRRNRQLVQVARHIDRSVPQTEERWSTLVELATTSQHQQRQLHAGMIRELSRETVAQKPLVVPEDVTSWRGLRAGGLAVCGIVVVLLVCCLADWQQTTVLLRRFWAPTGSISITRLAGPTKPTVAARGEPLLLTTTLSGRLVNRGVIWLESDRTDTREQVTVDASPGTEANTATLTHRVKAADESFRYRVRAGDGQTPWQQVSVVDRPDFAEIRFRATPPAYTGQPAVTLQELPEHISCVEGTTVEIQFRPRGMVQSVALKTLDDVRYQLSTSDGSWFRYRVQPENDLAFTAIVTEPYGLENRYPPGCRIEVYADRPPTVAIISPDETMAVRPVDTIEIEFTANDDFGIAKAELLIRAQDHGRTSPSERVIEIPLGEKRNAREITASVPLDLRQLQLEDGQSVNYSVRVYDTRQAVAMTGQPASFSAPSSPAEGQTMAGLQGDRSEKAPATEDTSQSTVARPGESATTSRESDVAAADGQQLPPASSSPDSVAPHIEQPSPVPSGPTQANTAAKERTPGSSSADPETQPLVTDNQEPSGLQSVEPSQAETSQTPSADRPPDSAGPQASPAPHPSAAVPLSSPQGDENSPPPITPAPPHGMPTRTLDIPQSATSGMLTLQIDQWAGRFSGQQRRKQELQIARVLKEIDELLAGSVSQQREVLDVLESNQAWRPDSEHLQQNADDGIRRSLERIADLQTTSDRTPYALIGLQLAEIAATHLAPASESLGESRNAERRDARLAAARSAWQQTDRARQRLAELVTQLERIRREHHLADAVEQVRTMYRVFLEDALATLGQPPPRINDYQRRMAQFDLDDAYLKRLEEVLKMRQELIAEFARILSDDPRLLRRFTDGIRNRSETLRDELTLLTLQQQELATEVRSWHDREPTGQQQTPEESVARLLDRAIDIARSAAHLQESFDTWLPLSLGVDEGEIDAVRQRLEQVAASAHAMQDSAVDWQRSRGATGRAEATREGEENESGGLELEKMIARARDHHQALLALDEQLLQLTTVSDHPALEPFVVRRLAETRRLIARESGWTYQLEQFHAGNFHLAASVEQHQIARQTGDLTARLADLEQLLAGVLQRNDGDLPDDIAALSRKLLSQLDEDVATSQLAAVFSLRRHQLHVAQSRTSEAAAALVEAEEIFDELIKRIIEEADQLPVQDPIADLLDDPTLDELLALLENERDLADVLGIPLRPSNLQVIGDFLRPGSGGSSGGGTASMVASQLGEAERLMQRAGQRARNRARSEAARLPARPPAQMEHWNRLASELEDRLLQGRGQRPPEEYRQAIEQYFSEISRSLDEQTSDP